MLIVAHLSLMIAATLCLIAGIGMAMFGRTQKTWLKWHKRFNTAGFSILACGAAMAFANVVITSGRHMVWVHQWIGLTAFILAAITLSLGYYSFKAANKRAVRAAHRWIGRLSGLAILSALTLGLIMIGIL